MGPVWRLVTLLVVAASVHAAVPGKVTGFTTTNRATKATPCWAVATNSPTQYNVNLYDSSASVLIASGQTATTCYTLTGLTASTTYFLQVSATNNDGTGQAGSFAVTTTAPSIPDASSVSVTPGTSQTAIPIQWTVPYDGGAALTGYVVRHSTSASMSSPVSESVAVASTTYTIGSLDVATKYYIGVYAVNSVGTATAANITSMTTLSNPPGQVAAPTVSSISHRTATIGWVAPPVFGSAITGYRITFHPATGDDIIINTSPLAAPITYNVTTLTPGTDYDVSVQANSGVGYSDPGVTTSFSTPAPTAPMTSVCARTLTALNYSTARVDWLAPYDEGSALISYTIDFSSDNFVSDIRSFTVSAPITIVTAPGLVPDTTYSVRIAATNAIGSSPNDCIKTIKTPPGPPDAVAAPTLTVLSNSSMTVAWTKPTEHGTVISNFFVYVSKTPTMSAIVQTPNTLTLSLTVSGLEVFTDYWVAVVAVANSYQAALGAIAMATTAAGTPAQVQNVTFPDLEITSTTVAWAMPRENGATITSYTVLSAQTINMANADSMSVSDVTATLSTTSNTVYYVQVYATNANGPSMPSVVRSVLTHPNKPDYVDVGTVVNGAVGATFLGLSWDVPANNGAPIMYYIVTASKLPAAGFTPVVKNATTNSVNVYGLVCQSDFIIRIAAVNWVGESSILGFAGPFSTSDPSPPYAVDMMEVTPYNQTVLILSWRPAYDGGHPITTYYVQGSTRADMVNPFLDVMVDAEGYDILSDHIYDLWVDGLWGSTRYYFRISSENDLGRSPNSSVVSNETLSGAPDAMAAVGVMSHGITNATFNWTMPMANGVPVVRYALTWMVASSGAERKNMTFEGADTLTGTISGLRGGVTYSVYAQAASVMGWSAPGEATTVATLPARAPEPVCDVAVPSFSYSDCVVTWAAPYDNGSPISSYTVQGATDASFASIATTATSTDGTLRATMYGLTGYTTFYFRVLATNGVGTSAAGCVDTITTPPGVPGNITCPTVAFVDNTTVTVTWTAPGSFGSSILNYTVYVGAASDLSNAEATVVGPDVLTFTAKGVDATATVYAAVTATNGVGSSTGWCIGSYVPPVPIEHFSLSKTAVIVLAVVIPVVVILILICAACYVMQKNNYKIHKPECCDGEAREKNKKEKERAAIRARGATTTAAPPPKKKELDILDRPPGEEDDLDVSKTSLSNSKKGPTAKSSALSKAAANRKAAARSGTVVGTGAAGALRGSGSDERDLGELSLELDDMPPVSKKAAGKKAPAAKKAAARGFDDDDDDFMPASKKAAAKPAAKKAAAKKATAGAMDDGDDGDARAALGLDRPRAGSKKAAAKKPAAAAATLGGGSDEDDMPAPVSAKKKPAAKAAARNQFDDDDDDGPIAASPPKKPAKAAAKAPAKAAAKAPARPAAAVDYGSDGDDAPAPVSAKKKPAAKAAGRGRGAALDDSDGDAPPPAKKAAGRGRGASPVKRAPATLDDDDVL